MKSPGQGFSLYLSHALALMESVIEIEEGAARFDDGDGKAGRSSDNFWASMAAEIPAPMMQMSLS